MNFIGHAAVARWSRAEPEYVLGSMLPDFAGMVGTRLAHPAPVLTATLSAGIQLHHRTDEVFHAAPGFVALQQYTLDTLTLAGVPRGTARAVGHIGVEMLIDGELLADRALGAAYLDALAADVVLDPLFLDDEAAQRYARLRTRLREHGIPYDYADPDAVLQRLQFVLARRPRLAITPELVPHVRRLLPGLQHKVIEAVPALLASVRAGLS